jgi:uncharacterized membrane protein YdjX (TVP38/TMEM64 family)
MSPPARTAGRLGVLLAAALILGLAWRAGALEWAAEPRAVARALVGWGAWGHLLFVLSYAALQPVGVPGTVFIVAAPMIWPWPVAFALSMVGTMAASVLGFAGARFLARDWVAARVPARLRRYEAALDRHAFFTVLLLRLLFWMPQALHAFLGVSRVGFWTHFWGSLLGYAPPLLVVSYFGAELFDGTGALAPGAWRGLAALAALSLGTAALARGVAPRLQGAAPAGPRG